MADEDTEITLGAGKLLGLFFMLAAVCGIFFAVGFSLGKTSAKEQALQERSAESHTTVASLSEPTLGKAASTETGLNGPGAANEPAKQPEPDLTFYKAVKQNGQETSEPVVPAPKAAQEAAPPSNTPATRTSVEPAPETVSAPRTTAPSAAVKSAPVATSSGTYLVQIAAVTREEDAAALAGALRKKSFAAAVVNSPNGKDKFFHVVVGPYATMQDAEAMKLKLQGEGYNPIIKRS